MKHPFESELLAGFPERLEQCTSDEWEATLKHLIWYLLAELTRNNEVSGQGKEWLERLIAALKRGPTPRKVGRPRKDEQATCDATLLDLLKVKTITEGIEALKRGPELKKVLRYMYPWLSLSLSLDQVYPDSLVTSHALRNEIAVVPTDDALRKRVERAAKLAGYKLEKGTPFGNQRKKP